MMEEAEIQSFWESHPCGDEPLGGLDRAFEGNYIAFFDAYDKARYGSNPTFPTASTRSTSTTGRCLKSALAKVPSPSSSSAEVPTGPDST